ncbi:hypothetical protein QYF36_011563 [Acer negundo]|nr:hypothetical protein QYF36_011563 [Acer negundo]
MFKYTALVIENELEKIVSSKAKKIDDDPCNVGHDVISIIMSLRVMYLKDYTQEVELAWATRLRPKGSKLLKRCIPALDSAVARLHKVVYNMGSCLEERELAEEESLMSALSVFVASLREHGGSMPVQGRWTAL